MSFEAKFPTTVTRLQESILAPGDRTIHELAERGQSATDMFVE
jgi:hypothetical protein